MAEREGAGHAGLFCPRLIPSGARDTGVVREDGVGEL
jgi:hypothetical protein